MDKIHNNGCNAKDAEVISEFKESGRKWVDYKGIAYIRKLSDKVREMFKVNSFMRLK